MNRRCFDCAFCSLHYPSFIVSCDIDDHVIEDVYNDEEGCDKFVVVEDDEEGELR